MGMVWCVMMMMGVCVGGEWEESRSGSGSGMMCLQPEISLVLRLHGGTRISLWNRFENGTERERREDAFLPWH